MCFLVFVFLISPTVFKCPCYSFCAHFHHNFAQFIAVCSLVDLIVMLQSSQIMWIQTLFLLSVFFAAVFAAETPSCDSEYGEHCPTVEAGWAVETCLLKVKSSLSKPCLEFIELQQTCKEDINKHCGGKEYTGDLLVCLTEWTKPENLSDVCRDKLPKKEEKAERTLSAAEKMKADRRRKARKEAANRVKKDL